MELAPAASCLLRNPSEIRRRVPPGEPLPPPLYPPSTTPTYPPSNMYYPSLLQLLILSVQTLPCMSCICLFVYFFSHPLLPLIIVALCAPSLLIVAVVNCHNRTPLTRSVFTYLYEFSLWCNMCCVSVKCLEKLSFCNILSVVHAVVLPIYLYTHFLLHQIPHFSCYPKCLYVVQYVSLPNPCTAKVQLEYLFDSVICCWFFFSNLSLTWQILILF